MRDTLLYVLFSFAFLGGIAAALLCLIGGPWSGIPAGLFVSALGFWGMNALEPRGEE